MIPAAVKSTGPCNCWYAIMSWRYMLLAIATGTKSAMYSGNDPKAINLNALTVLSSSINDRVALTCLAPFAWSGKGMLTDNIDFEREPMNMYIISSTLSNPTMAMMLAKAGKMYIWGIKSNNMAATIIKLIKGSALYNLGIGEFGVMVCLKKNLIGAINPGLEIGGPTLCCILA